MQSERLTSNKAYHLREQVFLTLRRYGSCHHLWKWPAMVLLLRADNRNALAAVTHVVLGTEEDRWETEDSDPVLITSLCNYKVSWGRSHEGTIKPAVTEHVLGVASCTAQDRSPSIWNKC